MKFLNFIGTIIGWMLLLAFCAIIATFFCAIFNPEGVASAFAIFKGLFGG